VTSKKQLAANRLNAQKSTGPRTHEGKARSAMNALQTGIDARSQTIPGESISQLEALAAEYYNRFAPSTPEQRVLVDTLVDCDWLLRRFRRVEGQMWEDPVFEITFAKAFRRDSDHFARLQRRIDRAHRHYHNALRELQRLQAEEDAQTVDTPPATDSKQTAEPATGFLPQAAPEPAPPFTVPTPEAPPLCEMPKDKYDL
jgi:hypothetical protein